MDGYDYIIEAENHAYLEDGGVLIIVGENMTASRDMVPYGPKTGVIAYGTFLSAVGIFLDIVILVALIKIVNNVKGTSRFLLGMLITVQIVALLLVVPLEVAREYLGHWYLGTILCKVWTAISHMCVPAMIWICVAISLDRICHVRRLTIYSTRNKGYKTPCLIIAATVFSVISVAPLVCWMTTEDFILEEVCAVMVDRLYTPVLTALCYFVPAVTCIFANISLSLVTTRKINELKHMGNQQESQTALDPKSRCGIHSRACRSPHDTISYITAISNSRWSVIAISIPCIVLWAPFYIVNLKIPFCDGFCLDPRLWALFQWIGYSYYIVGPCLYFVDTRMVDTVKSWVNGPSSNEQDVEYNKSITESDYSARSGYY